MMALILKWIKAFLFLSQMKITFLYLLMVCNYISTAQVFLPIQTPDRKSTSTIELTDIGVFGIMRKSRQGIPAHLHTGIDIKRPEKNYANPPFIFPIAPGRVVSKREDGPYSQVIVEHHMAGERFWTNYEHIASISVQINEMVHPQKPIARFYTEEELNAYGWQFDHFHLEVIRVQPMKIERNPRHPDRLMASYTLICYDQELLDHYFYDPIAFLDKYF